MSYAAYADVVLGAKIPGQARDDGLLRDDVAVSLSVLPRISCFCVRSRVKPGVTGWCEVTRLTQAFQAIIIAFWLMPTTSLCKNDILVKFFRIGRALFPFLLKIC